MRYKGSISLERVFLAIVLLKSSGLLAADILPYSQRIHSYNGFNTTVLGDIRTVGMGGATIGLADTFLAASSNPAGLSMTLSMLDTNITQNNIHDGNVQNYNQRLLVHSSMGIALNIYPWGFSIGIIPTGGEGQDYFLPSTASPLYAGQPATLLTEAHELRLGFSRLLLNNKLSLGMSFNIGIGEQEIRTAGFNDDRHSTALGATLGAMYQAEDRIFLAASYTLPMRYHVDMRQSPAFPDFFQPMNVPPRLEFGTGWIPNRFLRGSLQLSMIGSIPDAALLSDDSRSVGKNVTLQPKLGIAYTFVDLAHFRGNVYGGSYYEVSRIEGAIDRLHKTAGVELKAWMITSGIGIDIAPNYHNFSISIGVDLGTVLEDCKLVPVAYRPAYRGFFPNPIVASDVGLVRPLVADWKPTGPDMGLFKIISDLPGNTQRELKRLGVALDDLGQSNRTKKRKSLKKKKVE